MTGILAEFFNLMSFIFDSHSGHGYSLRKEYVPLIVGLLKTWRPLQQFIKLGFDDTDTKCAPVFEFETVLSGLIF